MMLKYNPPKLTIVYHFEHRENDQYFHDIHFDTDMLATETEENIVSHLYMSEPYYFNPKVLKRHQVQRLVHKLKNNHMHAAHSQSPERHSIHGNSPSPVRHNGRMGMLQKNTGSGSSFTAQSHSTMASVETKTNPNQQSPPFLGANIDGIPYRSPPK
jgi:hypothetical protein